MATFNVDAVVYGGTFPGWMAASVLSDYGYTVHVVDPAAFGGGLTRHGLTGMDVHASAAQAAELIGGKTRQYFFEALNAAYGDPVGTFTFNPEPKRVSTIYTSGNFFGKARTAVQQGQWLASVTKNRDNNRIVSVATGANTYNASLFIDASYTGDLMRLARVPCIYTREGRDISGERNSDSGNGNAGFGSLRGQWVVTGIDSNGQRLPGLTSTPRPEWRRYDPTDGAQPMNFRFTLTNTAGKTRAIPITPPANYSAANFALFDAFISSAAGASVTKLVNERSVGDSVFGGFALKTTDGALKYDCNRLVAVSSNVTRSGFGYRSSASAYLAADPATAAGQALRAAIKQEHYDWIVGLIYHIQTSAAVLSANPALQADALTWALPNDEFGANNFGQAGFPHDMYVRDTWRLVGQYVMAEADCMPGQTKPDPIYRWNYPLDRHGGMFYPRPSALTQIENEGGYNTNILTSERYEVPMRALMPLPGYADNLLAAWGISSTAIAWGSLRMEVAGMMAGEACAYVGHVALRDGLDPVRVPYSRIRPLLVANGVKV